MTPEEIEQFYRGRRVGLEDLAVHLVIKFGRDEMEEVINTIHDHIHYVDNLELQHRFANKEHYRQKLIDELAEEL